ncbi:hypothetical protein [Ferrovibrio sp.]|uniref:hypothetical protein n=1 Tax=Ferrovibrio sp. TaxID=1917215 RepID=UPI003D0EC608
MAFDLLPIDLMAGQAGGARGDIVVRGASGGGRLGLGSQGQVLTAGATDPAWAWRGWVDRQRATFAVATHYASTGKTVPGDDTIPQATEGHEMVTCSITPKHASNRLIVRATVPFQMFAGNSTAVLFLCRDAGADAIRTTWHEGDASTNYTHEIAADVAAGSTSTTTFKLRMGMTSVVDFVVNGIWNGSAAQRFFGGTMFTELTIDEYAP